MDYLGAARAATCPESGGIDSASAWHFELILVDFETCDFRIEHSRRQP